MKKLIGLFLIVTVFGFPTEDLSACLCIPQTLEEYVRDADIVFVGRVREIVDLPMKARAETISGGDPIFVVVDILKSWKGIKKQRAVIVKTNRDGAACGSAFDVRREYLIFADYDKAMAPLVFLSSGKALEFHKSHYVFFTTDKCMGTTVPLESEVKKLGKPSLVMEP